MIEQNKVYRAILEEIAERANGNIKNMSIADKLVYKEICTKYKADIVEFLQENLPIIDFWCDYNIEKDILKSKEPDIERLRGLDVYKYADINFTGDMDKIEQLHRDYVRGNVNRMGGIYNGK